MNVNFEAIEKVRFKSKKTVLDELEEWLNKEVERLMNIEQSNNVIFVIGAYTEALGKIQELKNEVK